MEEAPLPIVELTFGSLKQNISCQCDQPALQIMGFVEKNLALNFESVVPVKPLENPNGKEDGFIGSVVSVMISQGLDAFIYAGCDMILRASTVSDGTKERVILLLCKLKKPLFAGTTPKLHYPNFSLFLYAK